ncbi:transcriptional regulator [Rhodococcus sp. NCIMB 12038]|nr:transcriptional regulator [Rhodococcus sp. NCIMB 12038]
MSVFSARLADDSEVVVRFAWTADTAKGLSVPTDTPAVAGRNLSWQARAACRGNDLAVFFAPDAERGNARARREAQARQICLPCPVLEQCRDHALTMGEPYGVWGGMTETDRRRHTKRLRGGERRPVGSQTLHRPRDLRQTPHATTEPVDR